jgi:alpha-N-acetylglucosamine transferase
MKTGWATLVTRDNYMLAALVLAQSLKESKSEIPLIILHTPNLSEPFSKESSLDSNLNPILRKLRNMTNVILQETSFLKLNTDTASKQQFERFSDVWTKLNVWTLIEFDRKSFRS